MRSICILILVVLFHVGCTGNNAATNKKNEESSDAATENKSTAVAPDPKEPVVAFYVNDTAARTNKTTGGDTDDMVAIATRQNDGTYALSLELYGDVPERPHRGWLKFTVKPFRFEPAVYKIGANNNASFSRYETIDAGGETYYVANSHSSNQGTDFELAITNITKTQGSLGNTEYILEGTFGAKLFDKVYTAGRAAPPVTVTISNGSFKNLRLLAGLNTTFD
jgi:hypothetical protein